MIAAPEPPLKFIVPPFASTSPVIPSALFAKLPFVAVKVTALVNVIELFPTYKIPLVNATLPPSAIVQEVLNITLSVRFAVLIVRP